MQSKENKANNKNQRSTGPKITYKVVLDADKIPTGRAEEEK